MFDITMSYCVGHTDAHTDPNRLGNCATLVGNFETMPMSAPDPLLHISDDLFLILIILVDELYHFLFESKK